MFTNFAQFFFFLGQKIAFYCLIIEETYIEQMGKDLHIKYSIVEKGRKLANYVEEIVGGVLLLSNPLLRSFGEGNGSTKYLDFY